MSTPDLRAALRKHYPAKAFFLMEEVRYAAPGEGERYADAIAMGLWPSRGQLITGFEIKASRADWRRELKNPRKAERMVAQCDHWFVVAPPSVVKDGELPSTWGLLELGPRRSLIVKTPAPKNVDVLPLSRGFVAAMLRRAGEYDALQLELKLAERSADSDRRSRDFADQEIARERQAAAQAKASVHDLLAEIRERTGIDLNTWTPTEEIVRRISFATKVGGLGAAHTGLAALHRSLQKVGLDVVAAMEALEIPVKTYIPPPAPAPRIPAAAPSQPLTPE